MVRDTARRGTGRWGPVVVSALFAGFAGGCASKSVEPVTIPNRTLGAMTIAVAPALNFSGGRDFDPSSVADLMASELGYLEGVRVIPVSRVLAVLARQGRQEIGSPSHALEVAATLGADAILVFAVTEYDPYDPPIVGIATQLYGYRGEGAVGSSTPLPVVAEARPFGRSAGGSAAVPLAQTERVFNAAHESVVRELKAFAAHRQEGGGPWGWEKYRSSQRHYLRYCCHAIITEMAAPGELCEVAASTVR